MPDLSTAMATAARAINQPKTLEATLQAIVDTAAISVPGFTHVGISTLGNGGTVTTRAATDLLVCELDRVQYSLAEGPCMDSMQENLVTEAPELRQDPRWPDYVPRAAEKGVLSQLAVQLHLEDQGTLGGLNLYSTTSATVHPDAVSVAGVFATHAALAFGKAREVHHLTDALATRELIGQGVGLVMKEYSLDAEAAFAFLVRVSNDSNTKLRDVAVRLIELHTQGIAQIGG